MIVSEFERELDESCKKMRLGGVGARGCWKILGNFPECYAPPGGTYWAARCQRRISNLHG